MSVPRGHAHMSIGDALTLLRDEFPDVTISKIRFLESQGLIDPERTPSGYRKFYEEDVERLRFILREQKENFLPLKVIRDKLDEAAEMPITPNRRDTRRGDKARVTSPRKPAFGRVSLTRNELASASGLSVDSIQELERFGLIVSRPMGREPYFDDDALVVANLAAAFGRFGVEARHLRIYKNAAEREAGFFEQVVVPLLKQRSTQARTEALATLSELGQLGQSLRAALLRQALDKLTSP